MKKAGSSKGKHTSSNSDAGDAGTGLIDPLALGQILMDVSERAQPLLGEFFEKYQFDIRELAKDPMNIRPAYAEFFGQLWSNPQKLFDMQAKLWQDWFTLWHDSATRFLGGKSEDIYKPDKGDRRFKDPAWEQSAVFDFIKQSYLLTSRWMQDVVRQTEGLDDATRTKVDFYTRQFINALAPSNFLMTNPEVLQETLESRGENLLRGLENLLADLRRGHGELKISTTDYEAFRLGENIAITPGKVIYQNDLMQLLQFEATTGAVHKRPLLIIPPWINKYYILDLRPDNSFIRWLADQGHTVFIISWVNPNRKLAQKRFEDYMEEGILEALRQIEKATGEPDCNVIGYCLGGTLLAVTLAWLAANKQADKIASATFLAALVDFSEAGELKMFMDDSQLELMDREMAEKGFLSGDHIKKAFSLLRANDLIWSFVVNNYLMGKEPFPFDLLYWNDDSTNMPAAMHSFYMRKCYGENLLPVPGRVTMMGTPIDMRKVATPAYFLSTREDHIAPWHSTYATTQMFKGPCIFTLAASGHVAGVINPPAAEKYCHWTSGKTPADPEDWLSHAQQQDGSWWPHWNEWVKNFAGGPDVPARKPGGGKLKPVEDAPGSYVKMKAED